MASKKPKDKDENIKQNENIKQDETTKQDENKVQETDEVIDSQDEKGTVHETEEAPEDLLESEKEKFLRLAAEYDNFRKRSVKEREQISHNVKSETIIRLLPVYDNLKRALETPCEDESFYKGVEMTMTQLLEIFTSMGVEEIPSVGEKFDPQLHDAVSSVSEEGVLSGVITMEFQKGFTLNEKVIRHSTVQVNS